MTGMCVCDFHIKVYFADTDENDFKYRGIHLWKFKFTRLLLYKAQFGLQHNINDSYIHFQVVPMFNNNFQWLYGI